MFAQFIKHIRKHSKVSNTRKRKCWVKPWLTKKHKSLYHGLVSVLLLQDKDEFRMFLRMNTDTYEVSKLVLISRCVTSWERGGGLTGPKSSLRICALILILKIEIESPHKTETPQKCIFKISGEVKIFTSCWRLQDILRRNNLLFYLSEEFYSTDKKYWTSVFVYFNHLERSELLEVIETSSFLCFCFILF